MQDANTVLRVIRELGEKGRPLDRIYRQLYNRELYLVAYGRIYRNEGAMTPGVTRETVDGMSLRKIDAIIEAVRHERYTGRLSNGCTSTSQGPPGSALLGCPPGRTNCSERSSGSSWRPTMSHSSATALMGSGPIGAVIRL